MNHKYLEIGAKGELYHNGQLVLVQIGRTFFRLTEEVQVPKTKDGKPNMKSLQKILNQHSCQLLKEEVE